MDEEISLIELFMIIRNNRKLIIFITLFSIIITLFLTFFVLKPQYEVESKIIILNISPLVSSILNPSYIDNPLDIDLTILFSSFLRLPNIPLNTIKELSTSPFILLKVLEELKLDKKKYTLEYLKKNIKTEVIRDTNIVSIKIRDENPNVALRIANSLTKNLKNYICEKFFFQIDKLIEELEENIMKSHKDIEMANIELVKLKNNRNIREDVIIDKQTQINLLKDRYNSLIVKYNLLKIMQSINISEKNIVIEEGIPPEKPVSPQKLLNVIIGCVSGIMLSLFSAFLKKFWDDFKKELNKR